MMSLVKTLQARCDKVVELVRNFAAFAVQQQLVIQCATKISYLVLGLDARKRE